MSVTGQQVLDEAKKFLGDPYVYGGAGPATFDCSGLVDYVLGQLGVSGVPRTADAQYGWAQQITASQLQPGDLIFSQWEGGSGVGHVAFYAGNGQTLEASQTGEPVHFVPFTADYRAHVVGYGRPRGEAAATGAAASTGGGLLSLALPTDVLDMFSGLETFFSKILWIINPENVARIIAGVFGFFLLAFGIGFLIKAA
jgi:NlpC/P60 family